MDTHPFAHTPFAPTSFNSRSHLHRIASCAGVALPLQQPVRSAAPVVDYPDSPSSPLSEDEEYQQRRRTLPLHAPNTHTLLRTHARTYTRCKLHDNCQQSHYHSTPADCNVRRYHSHGRTRVPLSDVGSLLLYVAPRNAVTVSGAVNIAPPVASRRVCPTIQVC